MTFRLKFQTFFSITRTIFLTVGQNNFCNKILFLLLVTLNCGGSASENCTYFDSSTSVASGQCKTKICRCSDDIWFVIKPIAFSSCFVIRFHVWCDRTLEKYLDVFGSLHSQKTSQFSLSWSDKVEMILSCQRFFQKTNQ